MVKLDAIPGLPCKTLRANFILTLDMLVGGESEEDMKDAVKGLFSDHYEAMLDLLRQHPWFKDGLVKARLGSLKVMDDSGSSATKAEPEDKGKTNG